jgi:hypothetical protein
MKFTTCLLIVVPLSLYSLWLRAQDVSAKKSNVDTSLSETDILREGWPKVEFLGPPQLKDYFTVISGQWPIEFESIKNGDFEILIVISHPYSGSGLTRIFIYQELKDRVILMHSLNLIAWPNNLQCEILDGRLKIRSGSEVYFELIVDRMFYRK